MSKKLYIKTFGCQMNVYDSERMADALTKSGYESTDTPDGADMILLNTCHIREKAAEKVYSELGRYKQMREENPELLIGVAGCVAQAEGAEIMRRQPLVDLVVGPQTYHRLPELVAKAKTGQKALDTDFPIEDKFAHIPLPNLKNSSGPKRLSRAPTAFLTVQEGCDKFCAFCVVPYTRGSEVSRPVERLLHEAQNLVDQGVVEITLLGQNVNAYHGAGPDGKEWSLAALIREMSKIDGLHRIRFTTSHPRDMEDDLIEAHADIKKLMPYLHLPVQSGSNKILKAMNRGHTAESYLELIKRIKAARPDLALSGDFIVGFPGETEEDFQDTLNLVKEVKYAQAYSFKYSQRPGTPAAGAKDQVDPDVAQERLTRLQEALGQTQEAFQQACVGLTMPVLIEKPGKYAGQMIGRSPYLQPVHLECSEDLRGQIVDVKIESISRISLAGKLIENAA